MALTVSIAGTDRTTSYEARTLRYSEKLDLRTTCTFRLVSSSYEPSHGEEVIITDGGTTHFKGLIQKKKRRLLNDDTTFRYWITCGDYSYLLQQRRVNASYTSQTLKQIVEDIIGDVFPNEGFTTTSVETGPTIDKATFVYQYAADVFDQLSDLTGYHWYVGTSKDIHFESRESSSAAFDLSDGSANFLKGTLDHIEHKTGYRNRQTIPAGTDLTDTRVESRVGNADRVYVMTYPVGVEPTVKVNTVSKTVGIRGIETDKVFYWSKGSHEITYDDSESALGGGDTVEVTYQGLFPIVIEARNDAEIAARAAIEGGDGIYDHVEPHPEVNELSAATQLASGLLRRFGSLAEEVSYLTDGSGLRSGQLQSIDLTAHNIDDTFLITEVRGEDLGAGAGGYIRYSIKGVTGEGKGSWEAFFKKILRTDRTLVIRENEVVNVLMTITTGNDITLTESLSYSSGSVESRAGYATVGYSQAG